jgi:hypothetical protein
MGQEPWFGHIMGRYSPDAPQVTESKKLLEHCRAAGIAAEVPYCKKEILLPPL